MNKFKYLEDFEHWFRNIHDSDETLLERGGDLYRDEDMNFAYACYHAGRVRGGDDE